MARRGECCCVASWEFVASLGRPGRNTTGLSILSSHISPKVVEALPSDAPKVSRVAILVNPTVILGQGARRVIGVGRVKTPTLAIACERELEIRNFVPIAYFEIVATATVAGGQFQMRHAPPARILKRAIAETVVTAAQGFEGPLSVRVEDKRQGPPKWNGQG